MKDYFVLSGEGLNGSWSLVRCDQESMCEMLCENNIGSEYWMKAFENPFETEHGEWAATDVTTGEVRAIPSELIADCREERNSLKS